MTALDDFLAPLHQGVWEVRIPKDSVTDPLDKGWEKSSINIPSPGTIASYRKGQYHVHETATEWHVHLDRYDPKVHPLLHLVDDAPLLLMIAGVFVTLLIHKKGTTEKETRIILEEQARGWQILILIGIFSMLVGLLIISDPLVAFGGMVNVLIPTIIICIGILIIAKSISHRLKKVASHVSFLFGLCVCTSGAIAYYLPEELWAAMILAILAAWTFASSLLLLKRVAKGRTAVPEGFFSRLVIGILSLVLAVMIVIIPEGVLYLLMSIVAVIAILSGIALMVNGVQLRHRMKHIAK